MAQLAVVMAGLLLVAETQASDIADRSIPQGFLSKYMSSESSDSKSSMINYDKFITPNVNRIVDDKPVLHPATQVQDSVAFAAASGEPSIGTKDFDPPKMQKLLVHDTISLSAIGIGCLALVTMLVVRLRRGLQPATVPASNVLEMKSQDANVNRKMNFDRIGWGQQSSQSPCSLHVVLHAAGTAEKEKADEFTVIGNDGKRVSLSKVEKEQIFIDAIQSYYFDGRQVLSDADFDLLKEDLAWEGSEYAVLSRNETRFLGAMGAYSRGEEPIMSDDEFDALKASLKAQGSIVACSTEPRCFLDTGICSVTFTPDRFRGIVLYLPAISVLTLLWTGGTYELISASRGLNPLITLLIGSPLIVSVAQYLTEQVLFKDPFIAQGPCPDCGANNRLFFGDILGIEGQQQEGDVQCVNCKAALKVNRETLRVSCKKALA